MWFWGCKPYGKATHPCMRWQRQYSLFLYDECELAKYDWHTCLYILVYTPLYGQHIWILNKDLLHGDLKNCH